MPSTFAAKLIRVVVYVMLFLSAGAAFLLGDRLWAAARGGALPLYVPLIPVCAFTAFVVVYSVDRWILVKRRNYPLGRAFFQVALAILFATLLWPQQASEIRAIRRTTATHDRALRLLDNKDADVRAAMCELLARRRQIEALPRLQALTDADPSAEVRATCKVAAEELQAIGAEAGDTVPPTGQP
jgi:hypothetical protein